MSCMYMYNLLTLVNCSDSEDIGTVEVTCLLLVLIYLKIGFFTTTFVKRFDDLLYSVRLSGGVENGYC